MNLRDSLHGFTVTRVRHLADIHADMVEMIYAKNGARLIWLDRDDTNMTFSIAFKTVPTDDTGVFHILEHSVLCGSRKFPVKEPFVNLLQTSLQTFLNAMTFPDKTMYPVASRNRKDFLNLVDVYMDAVLHPAIYDQPEIFRQEGWHYEWDPDGRLICNGVVYNEMKGAYASVDTQLGTQLNRMLYPDTCYRYDSGGIPEHIPELTYEQFLACHRRFYHPSNAYIILDGRINLDEVLSLLDGYLRDYDAAAVDFDIADQPPVTPSFYEGCFPADDPESDGLRGQYTAGFLYGTFRDREEALAMEVLGDVLCGTNEAPLRKAVLDAGLAETISFSGSEDASKYQLAALTAQNIDDNDLPRLRRTIRDTLEHLAESGLDRGQLHASVNAMEFSMRERDFGSTPKGLVFAMLMLDTWLYGGDPAAKLELGDVFDRLRAKIDGGYFEELIRTALLDNPHRAEVYLSPSATLGEERRQAQQDARDRLAAGWDAARKQRVTEEQALLLRRQQAPDTPEQLATLPRLSLTDVSDTPDPLLLDRREVDGRTVILSHADTDHIVYGDLYFAAGDLTEDEVSAAAFLANLLDEMDTSRRGNAELQRLLKADLGAFSASLHPYGRLGQLDVSTPYLVIGFSVLERKLEQALSLVGEILGDCLFRDRQRAGQLLRQKKLAIYENIIDSGNFYAATRVAASFSARGVINEYAAGLEQYRWLCRAEKQLADDPDAFLRQMEALYRRIFVRSRLTVSLTGGEAVTTAFAPRLIAAIRDGDGLGPDHVYRPFPVTRQGIVIPTDVSFAALGNNLYRRGMAYHGQMGVASAVLSYTYLWSVIRVQNGAYGAGMSVGDLGEVRLSTYRDPNPAASLEAFLSAGAHLAENAPDSRALESLIIGAVGETDPLKTPRGRGRLAAVCHLVGADDEHFRQIRREMLATRPEDLTAFARQLQDLCAEAAICVIGNREQVEKCGHLDEIVPLT